MCTIIRKTRITLAFAKMIDKGGQCFLDDSKEMCHTYHLCGNFSSTVGSIMIIANSQPLRQPICLPDLNKPSPEKLAGNILVSLLLCLSLPLIYYKRTYYSTQLIFHAVLHYI